MSSGNIQPINLKAVLPLCAVFRAAALSAPSGARLPLTSALQRENSFANVRPLFKFICDNLRCAESRCML